MKALGRRTFRSTETIFDIGVLFLRVMFSDIPSIQVAGRVNLLAISVSWQALGVIHAMLSFYASCATMVRSNL